MYAAKDQLVNAFAAYFSLPNGERTDANYFVKTAEEELRDIGFNDHDLGKVHMLQHWAYVHVPHPSVYGSHKCLSLRGITIS